MKKVFFLALAVAALAACASPPGVAPNVAGGGSPSGPGSRGGASPGAGASGSASAKTQAAIDGKKYLFSEVWSRTKDGLVSGGTVALANGASISLGGKDYLLASFDISQNASSYEYRYRLKDSRGSLALTFIDGSQRLFYKSGLLVFNGKMQCLGGRFNLEKDSLAISLAGKKLVLDKTSKINSSGVGVTTRFNGPEVRYLFDARIPPTELPASNGKRYSFDVVYVYDNGVVKNGHIVDSEVTVKGKTSRVSSIWYFDNQGEVSFLEKNPN